MIDYRRLAHEDYDDIVDISKDVWDGEDYLPLVFHKWVDDSGYFMGAVDTDKNKVVGAAKYSILFDKSGWLEGLRVHKDYRGLKIARALSERLLKVAIDELKDGKIKKVAFATHASNIESPTLMKKLGFKLEQQYLIISKEYDKLDMGLSINDFKVEEWDISLDEFLNLNYFKKRSNTMPLAFVFQEPTAELYNELKQNKAFISINGFKGILKFKESANFISVDDSFDGINTFMNYCLVKYMDSKSPAPMTSVLPEDKDLIGKLKENGFESWNEWESDYWYFVYRQG